jgi:hypothetical protein
MFVHPDAITRGSDEESWSGYSESEEDPNDEGSILKVFVSI